MIGFGTRSRRQKTLDVVGRTDRGVPSTHLALALAGLLLVAGCTGVPGFTGPDATPTPDTRDRSPDGPTTPPERSPSEPRTTAPAPVVIDYSNLPNETRRSVRMAVENGSVLRDSDDFDGLNPRANQRLRYRGRTYALDWDTMHGRVEYGLEDVERVNASSLRPGSTVVEYANLSERARRMFHRASNGSRPRAYGPEEFPEAYLKNGHVEYRGELYEVTYWVGDIPQWELRVEPVEATSEG